MFDEYYDINIEDSKKRNTKVTFAVANDVTEIKQDMWYEEDGEELISKDFNEFYETTIYNLTCRNLCQLVLAARSD